ncbi:hypothetical protein GA0070622_1219 [Micromonospora sediminicola]|uniref:Uncharacterized protein n=1 Tax=Micromonospora sediminicola TaxID=946078 RepID=A0A1A9B5E2_9ACTN|nr:hypothetical protein [Micromonospora sediminicola]SBT64249.1 hypothetical protein GA0070622_1219 [Micromonospora sediminicola]
MVHRLNDDELRAAAATRPGYATYPEYRPGQPERLGKLPAVHRPPAPAPAAAAAVEQQPAALDGSAAAAPKTWYDNTDIWGPEPEPAPTGTAVPVGEPLDARPPTTAAEPPPATLQALPPTHVFDFEPRWIVERPWWRRRWHWAVMAADAGVHHGYAWTQAGARRRTARAARRAVR